MSKRGESYSKWRDNTAGIGESEIEQDGVDSESELVEWVESWFESITAREAQKRMVQNYVDSVTKDTVPSEKASEIAERVVDEFNSDE